MSLLEDKLCQLSSPQLVQASLLPLLPGQKLIPEGTKSAAPRRAALSTGALSAAASSAPCTAAHPPP